MKVLHDDAWRSWMETRVDGRRIKHVRADELTPGGRARVTLFAREEIDGRPHPRLQVSMPPWPDPLAGTEPPATTFAPATPPGSKPALREAIEAHLAEHEEVLQARDLDAETLPELSVHYCRNSVRAQRTARLFRSIRSHSWDFEGAELVIAQCEALAYAGEHVYDNHDTGTYHSFKHDKPFVHYLEDLLEQLPGEGTQALASQPTEQAEAIRKQRAQILNHLDHLMRHKYANEGVHETDIEKSVGGRLIDRDTRRVVSETPESMGGLVPEYELLRINPDADHANAGDWLYRSGAGLHLEDGTVVEVDEDQLRHVPVPADRLTFKRGPRDPNLREGVRLDWDGSGYVEEKPIGWIGWAGHCDIKAIVEQLGITLHDATEVAEWRSDNGSEKVWNRDLLLEMLCSTLELGSIYTRFDGSGDVALGKTQFGGARNDSRPDRIQLQGLGKGRHFRWPLSGRQDVFRITRLSVGDEELDLSKIFFTHLPDLEALTLEENPRFLKTVEGDYSLIDVSGATLEAEVLMDRIHERSGYPKQVRETLTIDLGPDPAEERYLLGTHVQDPANREIFRLYLDRANQQIVAELDRYEQREVEDEEGNAVTRWVPVPVEEETIRIPLADDFGCTLSREAKYDDPAMFQALLDTALRQGQNICADTDMKAEVWNGVVLKIDVERTGLNEENGIEAWKVALRARFGSSNLEYLVERDDSGRPVRYCPAVRGPFQRSVDFLWQDFPNVGSKGRVGNDWAVNRTMVRRGIVELRRDPSIPGGLYVHDEHIKNLFEILYCAMGSYPYTIVHNNKRYGFTDEDEYKRERAKLQSLRNALAFEE